MSGPLSKVPEGLLDLFGIKGIAPRYPSQLGEQVSPVFDVGQLVAEAYSATGWATGTLLAATDGATFINITSAMWLSLGVVDFADGASATTVPQGQIWLVHEAQVQWNFTDDPGNSANFWLSASGAAASPGPLVITDQVFGYTTSDAAVSRNGHAVYRSPKPFLLTPGQRVRIAHDGVVISGGGVLWQLAMRVTRLAR